MHQQPQEPGNPAWPYNQDRREWPPQTYPQGPPGYGAPGPPPGPPQGRRRRHPVRNTLIAASAVVVAVIIAAAAAQSGTGHTVTSAGSSATATASGKAAASTAARTRTAPARIGSSITLAGNSSGEQMAVTVVKVVRHGQPASEAEAPDAGNRLFAVQFRLADTGTAAYSDAPSNGAVVVDSAGQSYQSSLSDVTGCQSFPGTENIAAGSTGLGCVVFEVPARVSVVKVQFTLDSGMGPQTGQWDVTLKG